MFFIRVRTEMNLIANKWWVHKFIWKNKMKVYFIHNKRNDEITMWKSNDADLFYNHTVLSIEPRPVVNFYLDHIVGSLEIEAYHETTHHLLLYHQQSFWVIIELFLEYIQGNLIGAFENFRLINFFRGRTINLGAPVQEWTHLIRGWCEKREKEE